MRLIIFFLFALLGTVSSVADNSKAPEACGPVPSAQQVEWQRLETYAFIHFGPNTFLDQEWGYGDAPVEAFNPTRLDCEQWVQTIVKAGMKGVILTCKHHDGFCLWPSKYTDYSVGSSPFKRDVVRELSDACKKYGIRFGVYLSPWDRHQASYGTAEYVSYYYNQLEELMTQYGDIFEVWFDGANGGDGWYGGACEKREIDRSTYYNYPKAWGIVNRLQPGAVIFSDGGPGCRWVGNEKGYANPTNWAFLRINEVYPGYPQYEELQSGHADGDAWCASECNTSIRPGWFYHEAENEHVKSLSKLMDTYYKSVGRNSCLLLNFPIAPNGRIHPTDSLRGIAFNKMIQEVFRTDLAEKARIRTKGDVTVIDFRKPTEFNRFVAEEDIRYGQRVKRFSLEAEVDGQWLPLKDELVEDGDGLTTIGHRRIICFPNVKATRLRFTILDAKCDPLIKRTSVYLAPELTPGLAEGERMAFGDFEAVFE